MDTHPKHLPADERRAVTVESVVALAGSQNPSEITTAAIAKHMNLTQGALFRHFPNKEAIWQAVMGGAAQWYLEEARRLLVEFFTESNLRALGVDTTKSGADYVYEAGLTVRTAMDPAHQNAAGAALRRGLEELDKRQGWRGPVEQLDPAKQKEFIAKNAFSPLDLAGGDWVKGLVTAVDGKDVRVALGQGYTGIIPVSAMDPVTAVRLCTLNAAEAEGLQGKGAIAPGYDADCVLVDDLASFNVRMTFAGGRQIAAEGHMLALLTDPPLTDLTNTVRLAPLPDDVLALPLPSGRARVIRLHPGSLVTDAEEHTVVCASGFFDAQQNKGLCKLAVVERHKATGKVGVGILAGYGLRGAAVATSVSHDSHNIVVCGDNDADMTVSQLPRAVMVPNEKPWQQPIYHKRRLCATRPNTASSSLSDKLAAADSCRKGARGVTTSKTSNTTGSSPPSA